MMLQLEPIIKQVLWMLLWGSVSFCSLALNRYMMFYQEFDVPFFLAALAAAVAAVFSRVLVYLNADDTDYRSKDWKHLCIVGAASWVSVALCIASACFLPVPIIILTQVSSVCLAGHHGCLIVEQTNAVWPEIHTLVLVQAWDQRLTVL